MSAMLAERDTALGDYEAKVTSQQAHIQTYQGKLEEVKRLIANQDKQNQDLFDKLSSLKGQITDTENLYPQLREELSDVMKRNRATKTDLNLM